MGSSFWGPHISQVYPQTSTIFKHMALQPLLLAEKKYSIRTKYNSNMAIAVSWCSHISHTSSLYSIIWYMLFTAIWFFYSIDTERGSLHRPIYNNNEYLRPMISSDQYHLLHWVPLWYSIEYKHIPSNENCKGYRLQSSKGYLIWNLTDRKFWIILPPVSSNSK